MFGTLGFPYFWFLFFVLADGIKEFVFITYSSDTRYTGLCYGKNPE
jgi:hypothetical protein